MTWVHQGKMAAIISGNARQRRQNLSSKCDGVKEEIRGRNDIFQEERDNFSLQNAAKLITIGKEMRKIEHFEISNSFQNFFFS